MGAGVIAPGPMLSRHASSFVLLPVPETRHGPALAKATNSGGGTLVASASRG